MLAGNLGCAPSVFPELFILQKIPRFRRPLNQPRMLRGQSHRFMLLKRLEVAQRCEGKTATRLVGWCGGKSLFEPTFPIWLLVIAGRGDRISWPPSIHLRKRKSGPRV